MVTRKASRFLCASLTGILDNAMSDIRDKLIDAALRLAEAKGLDTSSYRRPENGHLTESLLDLGVSNEHYTQACAQVMGVEYRSSLVNDLGSDEFVRRVPIGYAREHGLLGLSHENGAMPIAIRGLEAWSSFETLGRFLDCPLRPVFVPEEQIAAAINRAYEQVEGQAHEHISQLNRDDVLKAVENLAGHEDLLDTAGRAPVIKLVNLMLFEAVKQQASDIHVQPYDGKVMVRMRIDGILFNAYELPKHLQDEVVSRIKVMGRMNIAEKRLAQDGRTTVQVGDRVIDLRISAIPTSFGERVVIRLLDKSARLYTLEELGMDEQRLDMFKQLIAVEHGLILVTGPTGSGKSTTLYAALQQINSTVKNILTLEDPIEYQLPGISQTQVASRKGMTFASGLRHVLRQDPDIIMVGEIRDHETAVMAIQSALTGHLVFSTLHTNDAPSAITRLLDLGIEPYLVASSLVGVLAQRLVRRICPQCAQPMEPLAEELARLELAPGDVTGQIRAGTGCERCRNTGYRGRVGLFELLVVDDSIRTQIYDRATASTIRRSAIQSGMKSLRDDGIGKVLAGQTTFEEVVRVTMRSTGADSKDT